VKPNKTANPRAVKTRLFSRTQDARQTLVLTCFCVLIKRPHARGENRTILRLPIPPNGKTIFPLRGSLA